MRYLILLITLSACSTSSEPAKTNVNPSWPNSAYQKYVEEKVKVLPRTVDEKEFCPQGLTDANKVHLLAAMAKNESNFRPTLEYKENFKNGRGEYVISTGLFQVSYESARGYGFPGITTEDLKDPYKNIDVAVAILKRLTERDGVVSKYENGRWRGASAYWSTLRSTGKLSKVKEYMRPYCQ